MRYLLCLVVMTLVRGARRPVTTAEYTKQLSYLIYAVFS